VPGSRSKFFGKAHSGKGKGKEVVRDEHTDDEEARDGSGETSTEDTNTLNSTDDFLGVPSVSVSGDGQSTTPSPSPSPTPNPYARYLTADWLPKSALAPGSPVSQSTFVDSPSLSSTTPLEAYAHARGTTEWIKLKDHCAAWEHTLDVVVEIGVDKDTSDLQPNQLKLVVMQVGFLVIHLLIYSNLT
jgi:hypothetical protein